MTVCGPCLQMVTLGDAASVDERLSVDLDQDGRAALEPDAERMLHMLCWGLSGQGVQYEMEGLDMRALDAAVPAEADAEAHGPAQPPAESQVLNDAHIEEDSDPAQTVVEIKASQDAAGAADTSASGSPTALPADEAINPAPAADTCQQFRCTAILPEACVRLREFGNGLRDGVPGGAESDQASTCSASTLLTQVQLPCSFTGEVRESEASARSAAAALALAGLLAAGAGALYWPSSVLLAQQVTNRCVHVHSS